VKRADSLYSERLDRAKVRTGQTVLAGTDEVYGVVGGEHSNRFRAGKAAHARQPRLASLHDGRPLKSFIYFARAAAKGDLILEVRHWW